MGWWRRLVAGGGGRGILAPAVTTFEELSWWVNREILAVGADSPETRARLLSAKGPGPDRDRQLETSQEDRL